MASTAGVGARGASSVAPLPAMLAIGFIAVALGAGNAAGGYVVTERMLAMFAPKTKKKLPAGEQGA